MHLRGVAIAFAVAALATATSAHADPTKDECVDADTRGQVARTSGKFRDAHAQFEICVSASCPEIVRSDCTERLDEVNRNAPSVIFDVKDASGADLAATQVTMDGKPLLERLDGKAVPVDPGEHTFVFTASGHLPNTQHVLVHEGDKDRRIHVIVGARAEAEVTETKPAAQPETKPEEPPAAPGSTQRTLGLVIGSTGVAGLVAAGILTGVSAALWQQSQNECNLVTCDQRANAVSDHDAAYGLAVAATVAVIAGGVLTATGAILFFTAPRQAKQEQATRRLRVVPLVGTMNGLAVGGTF